MSNAKSKNINALYNYNLNLDELERLTFLEISKDCLDTNNNEEMMKNLFVIFHHESTKFN